MSETRLYKNKIEHKSGSTLFWFRANKLEANRHVAAHFGTIALTPKSEDRKVSKLEVNVMNLGTNVPLNLNVCYICIFSIFVVDILFSFLYAQVL